MQRSEELARLDPAAKARLDRQRWHAWLNRYRARLQQEANAGASQRTRVELMNATNPRCRPGSLHLAGSCKPCILLTSESLSLA